MAITTEQLAVALRLIVSETDTLPDGQSGILTRLAGVAEAHTALLILSAPEAIQDECSVRMASYLYDMPPAGARNNYASAWVNSGAAALASRWVSQSIPNSEQLVIGTTPGTPVTPGGVTVEEVEALIATAIGLLPGVTPVQTANVAISTTQIKNLDTDYVELLAAPGIGQFLQIRQMWIHKIGSDEPLETGAEPATANVDRYGEYGLLIVHDDTPAKPWNYSTGNYSSVWIDNFGDLLRLPSSSFVAGAIGGHGLGENQPLVLGFTPGLTGSRNYTPEAYDEWIGPVNDALLTVFIRYETHSIYQFS